MKLREALDTYMFDNVGQFGGIAESLGYQTEYRDGYFRFRKDGEELSMSVSEIREKAGAKYDESLRDQSKERVSALFDKERANDPKYVAELEKDGISIKRWENLKGHDKDGFTVIDHRLKVCYTGQSLYEYAYKQGANRGSSVSTMTESPYSTAKRRWLSRTRCWERSWARKRKNSCLPVTSYPSP